MESVRKTLLGRRGVLAWCFYDWANSAYVTSIVTALLPVYYLSLFIDKNNVVVDLLGWQWHTSGTALWSYSSGFYMLAAAAAAPVLGAMADSVRGKRWFLGGFVLVGSLFTAGLAFVQPGQYLICSLVYVVSGFSWTAANIFYDGFLPELGDEPAQMEAISSAGFSLGYLGGGLMLAANLVMVSKPEWFGLTTAAAARWCFV
ncbi:MAG: MFS transporter, partial [Phycisphaerae bacterium]|nr:MFS transporter [Phycisphaerae bacterium]